MRREPTARASEGPDRRSPATAGLPILAARLFKLDCADLAELTDLLHAGVDPDQATALASRMAMSRKDLLSLLDISSASFCRKVRQSRPLSPSEGSRVIGMSLLIEQVKTMVEESGDPRGFDAARWFAAWLREPLPALGWRRPAQYMNCFEGQQLVSTVLARIQSGTYS